MFQPNRTNEAQMLQVMEKTYAGQMLSTPILLSEEIKNAGLSMSSIYEINKPYGSHQTYTRCRDNLNMVFREIEKAGGALTGPEFDGLAQRLWTSGDWRRLQALQIGPGLEEQRHAQHRPGQGQAGRMGQRLTRQLEQQQGEQRLEHQRNRCSPALLPPRMT